MDNITQILNNASPAKYVHYYRKLSLKVVATTCAIWFLHQCLNMNIAPNFIVYKTSTERTPTPYKLTQTRRRLIKKELRVHHAKLDLLYTRQKVAYTTMSTNLPFHKLNEKLTKIKEESNKFNTKKRTNMKKKLEWWHRKQTRKLLVQQSHQEPEEQVDQLYKKFINISDITFTEEETRLLENGLHHNPTTTRRRKDFERLMIDIEVAISGSTSENKDLIKNFCAISLKRMYNKQQEHTRREDKNGKIINNIHKKIKDHNLVVTRADKGKTVVILKRDDYMNRVEYFLNNNGFTKITKYNVDTFHNKIIKLIKSHSELLPDLITKSFRMNNYQIPRLYGLMKLHKTDRLEDVPIRPVVSFCNSSTYKIAKFMSNILRALLDFKPKYSLRNTRDLIAKITEIDVSGGLLASLDVTNLFTNIPPSEIITLVKDKLNGRNSLEAQSVETYIQILSVCLQQNVFKFNDCLWKQEEGLAMGSPISPILADIYLDHFENTLLFNNSKLSLYTNNIKFYHRYVDDIILLWTGSSDSLKLFLQELNKLKPNIQFTLELQNDQGDINFLDVTLNTNNTDRVEFKIFHKPTFTGQLINDNSLHHYTHKRAAFHSFIHRLFNTPMNRDNFEKELKHIKRLAKLNDYKEEMIDRMITKKQLAINRNLAYTQTQNNIPNENKYISLSFIGTPSYKIASIIQTHLPDVKIAFKNNITLRTMFENNKDKIDLMDRAGVYQLSCKDCNSIYIGKTYRHLKTRLKEHLNGKGFSQFHNHLKEAQHSFDHNSGIKLLQQHSTNNNYLLNLETLEIYKATKNDTVICLNDYNNLEMSKLFKVFD